MFVAHEKACALFAICSQVGAKDLANEAKWGRLRIANPAQALRGSMRQRQAQHVRGRTRARLLVKYFVE